MGRKDICLIMNLSALDLLSELFQDRNIYHILMLILYAAMNLNDVADTVSRIGK